MSALGYRGNSLLKKPGQNVEWTDERVEELEKCAADPIYFAKNYMKIIHLDRGLINFEMYDYQEDIIESVEANRNTIVATARQAGKSTTVIAYLLWCVIFKDYYKVAILANKAATSRQLLGRLQLAYQHLPQWLQQGVMEWNKGSIVLENESRIIAEATSSDAIRGESVNFLFIDEAAHIENWDEFFQSVFPTISSGNSTKIVLVSTPNGLNHFYNTWDRAMKGENNYNPIKVMWYDVPGRDDKWRQQTLESLNFDEQKFEQEYCVEFLGSSGTLIAGNILKTLASQVPISQTKYGLLKFEDPVPGHVYVLMADVSHGKLLDYSAFSIMDVTSMPYKQVCVFRNNYFSPQEYTEVICMMGKHYNDAWVGIENNDMGATVNYIMFMEYEYEYLLKTMSNGRNGMVVSLKNKAERGIKTTKTVKSTGCSTLKLLVEQQQLIINDFDTISELSTFSKKGTSYEAEDGKHDDMVVGLFLFGWLTIQPFFKNITDVDTLAQLREISEAEMAEAAMPLGVFLGAGDSESGSVVDTSDLPDEMDRWMAI